MPVIKQNGITISLQPIAAIDIAQGTAPKSFLGAADSVYIVKKPKQRRLSSIFANNLPAYYLEHFGNWTFLDFRLHQQVLSSKDKETLHPYFHHINDLSIEAAFNEVLYMQIIGTLFPDNVIVPEVYLHLDSESSEPWLISKHIPNFNEFLCGKIASLLKRPLKTSTDWLHIKKPRRSDLQLCDNELGLIGKLYYTALLTNDWDVFNNIMLANSGCIGDSKLAQKVVVVDGGNKFHAGFDGLTCDESSFKNPRFSAENTDANYLHTIPFDTQIYPQLPRMVVADLFDMDNEAIVVGFKTMMAEAQTRLTKDPTLIRGAIYKAYEKFTMDSDKHLLKNFRDPQSTLFNHHYYRKKTSYNLESILLERLHAIPRLVPVLLNKTAIEPYCNTIIDGFTKAYNFR